MEKLFDWIGDLFTKIWKLFKKILPYIMIALAVFFTFGGSLVLFGMVLEGYAAAIAAMGLSFLVAPEETIDTISGVAEGVGEAAGAIVSGTAGGLVSGLFGGEWGWLGLVAIGVGAWWLFGSGERKDNDDERPDSVNGVTDKPSDVVIAKPNDDLGMIGGVYE